MVFVAPCEFIIEPSGNGIPNCVRINKPSLWETLIAAAVSAFAIDLINDYEDEIEAAHDVMEEYLDLQMDISEYYHNFYVDIVNPQELTAMCYALNMEVPGPVSQFASYLSLSNNAYSAAKSSARQLLSGSCEECIPPKDMEFEIMAAVSARDSSSAELASDFRRQDRRLADKINTVLAAVNYGYKNPNHILGFVNSAINVQQNLINMAASGYNGALGLLGTGLGMLSNTLQARDRFNSLNEAAQQAQSQSA